MKGCHKWEWSTCTKCISSCFILTARLLGKHTCTVLLNLGRCIALFCLFLGNIMYFKLFIDFESTNQVAFHLWKWCGGHKKGYNRKWSTSNLNCHDLFSIVCLLSSRLLPTVAWRVYMLFAVSHLHFGLTSMAMSIHWQPEKGRSKSILMIWSQKWHQSYARRNTIKIQKFAKHSIFPI